MKRFTLLAFMLLPAYALADDAGVAEEVLVAAPAVVAPVVAVVAPVASVESDPVGTLVTLYNAVRGGNWILAASLVLVAVVFLARKYGVKVVPWLGTDRGGVVLVFGLSFLGALSSSLMAGGKVDLDMVKMAFTAAVAAMGGYQGFKRLVWPKS